MTYTYFHEFVQLDGSRSSKQKAENDELLFGLKFVLYRTVETRWINVLYIVMYFYRGGFAVARECGFCPWVLKGVFCELTGKAIESDVVFGTGGSSHLRANAKSCFISVYSLSLLAARQPILHRRSPRQRD